MIKLILFFFICSLKSFCYINIYPTKFEKNITNDVYEEFFLYNKTSKSIRYRIYLEDLPKENSMTKWIEIYPKDIVLKPLEERSIKLLIKAPKNIASGKYTSNLVVKEVENIEVRKKSQKNKLQLMTLLKLKLNGLVPERKR